MTARTLDGKATLANIKDELKARISALAGRGIVPGLGTLRVWPCAGTSGYGNANTTDRAYGSRAVLSQRPPPRAGPSEAQAIVAHIQADPACTGVLVQQPTGLDEVALLSRVDPRKDVDVLNPYNLGCLVLGQPAPLPCTPVGILELLRRYDVPIAGAHVVVIGRGLTVGRPLGLLLTRRSENATVTLCHTGTRDLALHVERADIVVAAAGVAGIVTADMAKPGAAVVEVGVRRGVGGDGDAPGGGDRAHGGRWADGWRTRGPGGAGARERGPRPAGARPRVPRNGMTRSQDHIRNTPNFVAGIGAFSVVASERPSTRRVSAGSMTPSSHRRALA